MSTYSSKPVTIARPVDAAYAALSDFSQYQNKLDQLPEELRAHVGQVRFTPDSFVVTAAPVGDMEFEVVERVAPTHVKLAGKNSPVPMQLIIDLTPADDTHTQVVTTVDVDIPVVLKPLVGNKMQTVADKFGDLISMFFNHSDKA